MRLALLGVRGSTPSPGTEFVRYGGHTSCIAVSTDDAPPRLVIDAGTGIRALSDVLGGRPFEGTLLLSHLHWDHTQGLPFCAACDRPDACVDVRIPAAGDDARAILARAMSPPHFPIGPEQLRGRWSFSGLEAGDHEIGGFGVLGRDIPHKGGRTFGFRITDGSATVAYMSDHGPIALGPGPEGLGEYHAAALELAADADVLIHDAQYTAAELADRRGYGHSAAEYAVGLARAACARRVVLFHHDPARTDPEIDAILDRLRRASPGVPVDAAIQGDQLTTPSRRRRAERAAK